MRVIAMYLPQFHKVTENEQWWGDGYTEWTAVRNAERLYENHYQPRVPLNNNYYDLMQKSTIEWQTLLMKKYNIYGMCFYHYYFENGKKILEKPAEHLLEWKDIDMPFCFSWANESWARTWSKLQEKNSWNYLKEEDCSSEENGILLKQDYGDEADWEKHFDYLIPFFKDKRYIKLEGRPVFIIYKPDSIPCLPQMMETWNKLAEKHGMKQVYFVATNSEIGGMDAYLRQEANYSDPNNGELIQNYDKVCESIVKNARRTSKNHYFCGFPGYDDTPRRGESGEIIEDSTPEKFCKLMKQLFFLGDCVGNEFTFVNAWNEWGEGMYLEPDEKYGYAYLEALNRALLEYKDISKEEKQDLIYLPNTYCNTMVLDTDNLRIQKNSYFSRLFDKWLLLKEKGDTLHPFFERWGYRRIALYGLGIAGNHLLTDLEKSQIKVIYGIDKLGNKFQVGFPVYTPDSNLPEADVIVISVTYDFGNIYKNLKRTFTGPIVSLEKIIDYCLDANILQKS